MPSGIQAEPAGDSPAATLSRSASFTRGALTALSPAMLALAHAEPALAVLPAQTPRVLAIGGAAAFALAALAMPRWRRGALLLVSLALIATFGLAMRHLAASPLLSLIGILLVMATAAAFGRRAWGGGPGGGPDHQVAWSARGCAAVSTVMWLLVGGTTGTPSGIAAFALGATAVVATAAVTFWLARFSGHHRGRRAALLAAGLLVLAILPFVLGNWGAFFGVLALFPAVALLALPLGTPTMDAAESIDWLKLLFSHPPRLLVFTFALLCLVGTVALTLPISAAHGKSIAFIDALFTAVSAVCVTGLIVLDTPVDFSGAGQAILAALIQLGGLGIMTFSTAALALLGKRLSLLHEGAVAGLLGGVTGRLFASVKTILLVTAVAEGAGAILLWIGFVSGGDPPLRALGKAVFTAISAFCNAGFALQSDSLVSHAGNPLVLHTVAVLIVLGGLSPLVIVRLSRIVAGRHARAQEKLVLAAAAFLIVVGALLIAALEWNASLAPLSTGEKLGNALFQSITLRTAGFNSVDLTAATTATISVMLVWMFIGGSPVSTAGGIKTTTAAVLMLAVLATVRGHPHATVFHRRIPHSSVYRAAAIATVGAASVFAAFMTISLTQNLPTGMALFEVVSALGTVGLSLGATLQLDQLGKLIIVVCMFAGRLGPLTLFLFLSRKPLRDPWDRPSEDIDVG